jgi:tetratricopeptide (TPR) repeat protein
MKKLFYLVSMFVILQVVGVKISAAETEKSEQEKLEILNRQISFFDEQLKVKPNDPKWHFQLGTKYYELGRFYEKKADRIFLTRKNDSDISKARSLYKSSVEHLKQSFKIQPSNAGAHFNLSLSHFVEGDAENAITHMRKSEQLFMALHDKRGVAKARKALREWFDRYGYRPEDF